MIATAALREKLVEAYEWPVCDQNGVSRRFIANYCSRCTAVIAFPMPKTPMGQPAIELT